MAEKKETAKTKRPTALKRDIQGAKRNLQNRMLKARLSTAVRTFEENATKENLQSLQALLDKSVKSGVNKLNKVSRLKGKFASKVA